MATKKCPKCDSANVEVVEYAGGKFLFCKDCNYDASKEVDIVADGRTSQKAKGEYTVYKSRIGKK